MGLAAPGRPCGRGPEWLVSYRPRRAEPCLDTSPRRHRGTEQQPRGTMARRGKAANRNARRRTQRNAAQRAPGAGSAATPPTTEASPSASAMPDAFEIADAEVRAAAQPPLATTAGTLRSKPRAADPRVAVGSSRLSERAVAEYHYVRTRPAQHRHPGHHPGRAAGRCDDPGQRHRPDLIIDRRAPPSTGSASAGRTLSLGQPRPKLHRTWQRCRLGTSRSSSATSKARRGSSRALVMPMRISSAPSADSPRCSGRAGAVELGTEGDSFFAVFASASDAVASATEIQRAMTREAWPDGASVRVRIGIHSGVARVTDSGYVGLDVHRAARIMATGHGGQIVISDATASLAGRAATNGIQFRDLGEHRLRDLSGRERLFQVVADGLPTDFPRLRTLDVTPNNLPTQPSELIGRQAELATIREHLDSGPARLLTLVGPGGIGKTRVAVQAAAQQIDRFTDGVFFVDLSAIRDPSEALEAMIRTIGEGPPGERALPEAMAEQVGTRHMLLVLDNFEQVMGAAEPVAELLRRCPELGMLITSRQALRVRGEQLIPLAPLPQPDASGQIGAADAERYDAVRLFVDRAREAEPDFALTDANATIVAEICGGLTVSHWPSSSRRPGSRCFRSRSFVIGCAAGWSCCEAGHATSRSGSGHCSAPSSGATSSSAKTSGSSSSSSRHSSRRASTQSRLSLPPCRAWRSTSSRRSARSSTRAWCEGPMTVTVSGSRCWTAFANTLELRAGRERRPRIRGPGRARRLHRGIRAGPAGSAQRPAARGRPRCAGIRAREPAARVAAPRRGGRRRPPEPAA